MTVTVDTPMSDQTLPAWLVAHTEQVTNAIETNTDAPDPKFPRTKEAKQLRELQYEALFERVLESLEAGEPASRTIRADPRNVEVGNFMSWIRRNPDRFKRFEEAKQNGMLILEDKLLEIAEGSDSTEDVQRSKLRADTIKWVMQSWDKRYKPNEKDVNSGFSGGITVLIGEVESPYVKREPLVLENGAT